MKTVLMALSLALPLAGCGEPSQPPAPEAKLFEPQRETLDKSRQVEQIVTDQADQQKQAVDQQTQ